MMMMEIQTLVLNNDEEESFTVSEQIKKQTL